ncbi:hypothetical protein FQN57_005202 [Myotisia sp. PD_48]|nr:hypothetical protein FQN57_005202 [Myotisia sp. PD_48]
MNKYQFLQDATLTTVVPHSAKLNLEELLNSSSSGSVDLATSLAQIRQRPLLFFDERVTLYIILRLSNFMKDALESCVSSLTVQFEAVAIDTGSPDDEGEEATGTKDLIYSDTVDAADDPLVIVNESPEEEHEAYIIWKAEAFLHRPQIRLRHPSVVFTASSTFSPHELPLSGSDDQFLPPLTPASVNIFQPYNSIRTGKDIDPYLPASRILRLVPTSQSEEIVHKVHQISHNPIRIIPAASARIRHTRPVLVSGNLITTASLDFEPTPFTNYEVMLEEADLLLAGGNVEALANGGGVSPALRCLPRDDVTLVYRLALPTGTDSTFSPGLHFAADLDITLRVTVLISEDCKPEILMRWRTSIDFSKPTVRSSRGHSSQGLGRDTHRNGSATAKLDRIPHHKKLTSAIMETNSVNVSICSPCSVEVGKAFDWDIFVVNRSSKPRKFGIVAIPNRRRFEHKMHAPKPSTSSQKTQLVDQVAEAIIDENVVYAMQQNVTPYETDLLCLSTDIKIGPLLPGTCHSTKLRLLPLAPGILHFDVVKLIDLTTNEAMDLRDLPDIIASSKVE